MEIEQMDLQQLRGWVRSLQAENKELTEAVNEFWAEEQERRNHERQWD